MSAALFDTTHWTNQYDLRLGYFTTRNEAVLLAVYLVKREDLMSLS